jgi:hypothetical protein
VFQYLSAFAAVLFVGWAQHSARQPARKDGQFVIVEYTWSSRILGVVAVVLFGWLMLQFFREDGRGALFFLPFELAVLALAANWWLTQIRVGPEQLEVRSPWRRRRSIPWDAVRALRGGMKGYRIETATAGLVRFNQLQRGHRELLEMVKLKTR